ncbi:sortase domain-bontaining protein [Lysobacter korlensis]|uniref:Sortase domain-bontaining protein n=1 Tax=Lysobacter korlensis TaxID=553636 RepID=A0ABV6RYW1_9GAMM
MTASPGAVAEQPARAVEVPQAPRPDAERVLPAVPIRSAAVEDHASESSAPPDRVAIPTLDLDLPVRPVGVHDDGSMEVPENPSVVGWYRFGPAPGSAKGATVLAAHVDSLRYGLGPFAQLKTLQPGAEVLVSDTAGRTITYRVEEVTRTGKADLVDAGVFDRSGTPRLHLITCGGSFHPESRTYSDNVIVTAIPAE